MRLARLLGLKTAPARSRRRQPRRSHTAVILIAVAAVVVVTVVGGTWQLVRSGWIAATVEHGQQATLALTGRAGLRVDEVLVEGRSHTETAQLLAALGVRRGMPILAFDPQTARHRVEALGWVRRASVARRLPNLIYVRIEERYPIALWQHGGRHFLVDREGAVILRRDSTSFDGLPTVVGDEAPDHAAALLDLLTGYPSIAARVEGAVLVSRRRWNLRLANGVDVRLPEHGIAAALGWLADLERDHGLLTRDVVALDLRQPDRLIVRLGPAAAAHARGEQNT